MIKRAYQFDCDYCGERAAYVADNLAEAKEVGRSDGWKLRGKRGCCCCEECYLKMAIEEVR